MHDFSKRYNLLILTLLILFGFFVRVLHVGDQSLWGDEAFTYIVTKADFFVDALVGDVHPPLYFALLASWVQLAGDSEFSMRLLSVFAGTVNLALVYALTREILRHRQQASQVIVPLLAVGLLALSDLEILVAQEARSYTVHLIWVQLSIFAYLRWLRTDARLWLVTWSLSTTLIVYTHYIGVFTPLTVGLHVILFLRGRKLLTAIGALALSTVPFLPWLFGVMIPYQIGKFAGDVVLAFPSTWGTLWHFRMPFLGNQWALMLLLALFGLVILNKPSQGEARFARTKNEVNWRVSPMQPTVLLVLWIVVPMVLAFVTNLQLPTLQPHRLTQMYPALVILIALGLANFQPRATLFMMAAIVLFGVTTVDTYRPKPPWREFGEAVAQYAQVDDAIVLDFTGGDYTMEYYLDHLLPNVPYESVWQWTQFQPDTYESGMLGYIYSYDSVWVASWSNNQDVFDKLHATGHVRTWSQAILPDDEFNWWLYRYDRLPEDALAIFDNGMILQHADINPDGQVDLWWTTETDIERDYTISVKLLQDGAVVGQVDGQAQLNSRPTSTWATVETLYDPYQFDVPAGTYSVSVQVYLWTADRIQPVLVDERDGIIIGEIVKK